ncbi:MAG: O-acetylhomoserine aminocarboxypropyltransferase/cysteine synthase family protein [Bacillota bacterium]
MKFATKLVNLDTNDKYGATNTPVYLSNSFAYDTAEELEEVFNNRAPGYVYSRINNPSLRNVEQKLAALAGGVSAILTSSGMSAIATATLNLLSAGDEFVATNSLFGGTYNLFKSYEDYGIIPRFSQGVEREDIAKLITPQTKFVFVEMLGNPKLDIPDLEGIAELCQEQEIPLIVDNTMLTPAIIKPLELGANLVIHSTSKYINGTANSIGGVIVDGANFDWTKFADFDDYQHQGKLAFSAKARASTHRNLGTCASPLDSFLNELGISTLDLRMKQHCRNALELAEFLEEQPTVEEVNYPGLSSSPYHKRAKSLCDGKYGGILTLRVGSKERAFEVINNLDYFYNLANIGDVKSLVIHPASTIYTDNTAQERQELGVSEDLIRVSVGIEDIEDLKQDFKQALSSENSEVG